MPFTPCERVRIKKGWKRKKDARGGAHTRCALENATVRVAFAKLYLCYSRNYYGPNLSTLVALREKSKFTNQVSKLDRRDCRILLSIKNCVSIFFSLNKREKQKPWDRHHVFYIRTPITQITYFTLSLFLSHAYTSVDSNLIKLYLIWWTNKPSSFLDEKIF